MLLPGATSRSNDTGDIDVGDERPQLHRGSTRGGGRWRGILLSQRHAKDLRCEAVGDGSVHRLKVRWQCEAIERCA